MSNQIRGFFRRITGDGASYDALTKPPITDAETRLKLFNDATTISITAIESYIKYMSKLIDQSLSERFNECKEIFSKYEKQNDQVMGTVFGKLSLIQGEMNNDVTDLIRNIEFNVLKPLNDYQEELKQVKENKKELKEAYDKIEICRLSLEKSKKEADYAHRVANQSHRMSTIDTSHSKKTNDLIKIDEKVMRSEKELDEATAIANEKYDKYTETLYKRISEECELSNYYVQYLNNQRKYHKRALKKLDLLIPDVDETIQSYTKKPVFGSPLEEYVQRSSRPGNIEYVSPVIRKLIESMCKQNAFNEEGLFRIAGSRVKMNCLLNAINAGYLDYLDTNNDFDIHCLAGVLKQYIRELPDSLLCNEFHDEWIKAIGTSPMTNKIEAYKDVLERLPKVNYENIRYLIKFLAKIVQNSDKTKMTTANMGICFGVSLLSSNGPLSNSTNQSQSEKVIDMATATNVFDFLLTNHAELFPEEINFVSIPTINNRSNYGTLSRSNGAAMKQIHENTTNNIEANTTKLNTTNQSQNDSINEVSASKEPNQQPQNYSLSSPFQRSNLSTFNSSSSPVAINNTTANTNIIHMNRHFKKSSYESRQIDRNELFSSNNSINSVGSVSNMAGFTNKPTNNMQSPIQSSIEPGSMSPKQRSKKMVAPPPPLPMPRVGQQNDSYNSVSQQTIELNFVPPALPSSAPEVISNEASLYPKLSSTSTVSTSSLNTLKIQANDHASQSSSPSISPASSCSKTTESTHQNIIEKPSQPPPLVPNRPPPIGFNFSVIQFESNAQDNNVNQENSTKINPNINLLSSSTLSTSSSSSSSSSSQEMLNSMNGNINNHTNKGPKPAVPRRPGNILASHINKISSKTSDDLDDSLQQETLSTKSSSEITSL